MTAEQEYELIRFLKKVKGAINYDGEASVQVYIPLEDGSNLRIGRTDDDVADQQGLWFDFYGGLNIEGAKKMNK